jgi:hypothetical protein
MSARLTVALLIVSFGPVQAACINPPVASQLTDQFKANPEAFVAPNSDTRTIEAYVRDLAGTDASLAAGLVQVAERTVPRFRTAIAAGLAQAAIACETTDQSAALLIQQAVANFPDGPFQASFAAVAGDLSTAATSAAGAAAAGSAGSVTIVNPVASTARASLPGGRGAVSGLVQITSPSGVVVTNTPSNALGISSVVTTAAGSVSPTE